MRVTIDRAEASRALAKVIAYTNVAKEYQAEVWTIKLLMELGMEHMIEDWSGGLAQQQVMDAQRIR